MKNIMLIVPKLAQGGQERICLLTARILAKEYRVTVVIFSDKDKFYSTEGLDVINLNIGASSGKISKIFNVLRRTLRLGRLKKKLKTDLAYSFGNTANLANVLSRKNEVIWTGIRQFPDTVPSGQRKFIYSHADAVVSCTAVMDGAVWENFRVKKHFYLYNPLDTGQDLEKMKEPVSEDILKFLKRPGRTVVAVGRMDDQKGYWHLVKAVGALHKRIPVKLLFMGVGETAEYEALAKAVGLEEDVFFAGGRKNPFSAMKACDVFALTSPNEGFPNTLVEALLCGLVTVSVNCKTGPAEILGENPARFADDTVTHMAEYGILTPALPGGRNMNPEEFSEGEQALADALFLALSDETVAERYRKTAMSRALTFSNEAYEENIKKAMEATGGSVDEDR